MKKLIILTLSSFLLIFINACTNDDDPDANLATVETIPVTEITDTSATSGGNITDDGGDDITERGVCWNTAGNPTIDDDSSSSGTGTGIYSCELNNLLPNTTYYVCAYVTNSVGTSYGNELSFEAQYPERIYTGNVYLKTQEDVDDFGVYNFTEITGYLTIGDYGDPSSSITDLTSLSSINLLGGRLSILHNDALNNLSGLDNITSVDGIMIRNNPSLISLSIFDNIDLGGGFDIMHNDALIELPILDNISWLSYIDILGNDSLSSFSCLDNLSTVNIIRIAMNDSLTEISLNNLSLIEDSYLDISHNNSLTNISFINLSTVGGWVSIDNNPNLINIDLNSLTTLLGSLSVRHNDLLIDLSGMANISSLGGNIYIESNNVLIDLSGLNNISSVDLDLKIIDNASLQNLSGLENLISVGRFLKVSDNNLLTDLCGIRPLLLNNGLGGTYTVEGNAYNPTQQDIIDGNCSQ